MTMGLTQVSYYSEHRLNGEGGRLSVEWSKGNGREVIWNVLELNSGCLNLTGMIVIKTMSILSCQLTTLVNESHPQASPSFYVAASDVKASFKFKAAT